MPTLKTANPQISVRLYKTISRETVDGQIAVSARYRGKAEFIELTPFLGDGASVRTSKSVREPAGGFVVTFADKANSTSGMLESVYGLVEPMDVVEIRMWGGTGVHTAGELPVVMRGFVSEITRGQAMSDSGQPVRTVAITGQDYGKLWQTYQVIYLAAYAEGKPLLTNFQLFELFGVGVTTGMKAGEFVRTMVEKVINPHLKGLMPENSKELMKKIQTGKSIAVKHGVVNNSYQQAQGSIYDILKFHGDVGVWNELYLEDREDGVHVVYRPIPALKLSGSGATGRETIQDDAPKPTFVPVPASLVKSLTPSRGDAQVVNFFWVNNSSFDLIDDGQRKLMSIPSNDSSVSLKDYPNTAVRYYGARPMFAQTQQWDDALPVTGSGQDQTEQDKRTPKLEAWLDRRRRLMAEMNKDNVVLERGSATIKGGIMRPGSDRDLMKAGDYALFQFGGLEWVAYVTQVDHEWIPFQGYTQTLHFERGEGFVTRARTNASPYLVEQSTGGL